MPIRMNGIKYFLTEELADMIPLTQKAIQAYIKKGRIHGIKIGRSWYVSNASLNEFLATGRCKKVTTE